MSNLQYELLNERKIQKKNTIFRRMRRQLVFLTSRRTRSDTHLLHLLHEQDDLVRSCKVCSSSPSGVNLLSCASNDEIYTPRKRHDVRDGTTMCKGSAGMVDRSVDNLNLDGNPLRTDASRRALHKCEPSLTITTSEPFLAGHEHALGEDEVRQLLQSRSRVNVYRDEYAIPLKRSSPYTSMSSSPGVQWTCSSDESDEQDDTDVEELFVRKIANQLRQEAKTANPDDVENVQFDLFMMKLFVNFVRYKKLRSKQKVSKAVTSI